MGHDGMLYSLPSRDIIADALEMNIEAHRYDAAILIPSCDKNMPACMIAAARYNRPTVMVYGGAILAGKRTMDCPALGQKVGDPLNIGNVHESYGGLLSGDVSEAQHEDAVRHACPGAGSCGGESRVCELRSKTACFTPLTPLPCRNVHGKHNEFDHGGHGFDLALFGINPCLVSREEARMRSSG